MNQKLTKTLIFNQIISKFSASFNHWYMSCTQLKSTKVFQAFKYHYCTLHNVSFMNCVILILTSLVTHACGAQDTDKVPEVRDDCHSNVYACVRKQQISARVIRHKSKPSKRARSDNTKYDKEKSCNRARFIYTALAR